MIYGSRSACSPSASWPASGRSRGAARELALSQPSVSHQVAALEQEIGARLLDRSPGGLRLTRAGALLLEHADAIAARFDLAALQLAEIADDERTLLRIGAFPTALAGFVPSAVAQVRAAAPGRPGHRRGGRRRRAARPRPLGSAPSRRRLPGRRRSRAREFDDLERHDLLREPFLVALPPDHKLAGQRAVRLIDLADDDWTAAFTDGLIVRACRAAGFEPRLVSLTRDQLAIRALITRGLAVTLAPRLLAEAFTGTALRPIAGEGPERDVYALLPPGGRHPLAQPMLTALAETAEELRDELRP